MSNREVSLARTLLHRAQRFVDVHRSGHRNKVRALRDRHAGRRAYIIGNGPSVRLEDLDQLRGEITFCCNRFHLAYPLIEFRPRYTVVADAQMLRHFGEEIAEGCGSDLIVGAAYRPKYLEPNYTWVRLKQERPFHCRPAVDQHIAPGGSVVVVALQLAFYMGIREVYLYGIDHDFSFSSVPGKEKLVSGDGNHFIPEYREGRIWYRPEVEEIEEAMAACRQFYEAHGGQILNATRGGKLRQIDRVDFEEVVAGPKVHSPEAYTPAVQQGSKQG